MAAAKSSGSLNTEVTLTAMVSDCRAKLVRRPHAWPQSDDGDDGIRRLFNSGKTAQRQSTIRCCCPPISGRRMSAAPAMTATHWRLIRGERRASAREDSGPVFPAATRISGTHPGMM
jgi:hypothetical protein